MDTPDEQPLTLDPSQPRPDDWLICWHSRWEDKQPSPRATYGKVRLTKPFYGEKLRGCLEVAGQGYGPDRDIVGLLMLRTDPQGRIVCSLRTHPHETDLPTPGHSDPHPTHHPVRRDPAERPGDQPDDGA